MDWRYTRYGYHVKDLNAALRDSSSDNAREALSLLHSDGVAQVMSFMCRRSLKSAAPTLAAASPEMRLDLDILTSDFSPHSDCVQVRVVDQRLVCHIKAVDRQMPSPVLVNSLWWAERRGMAVNLDADNASRYLLGLLSNCLRSRVEALDIHVSKEALCARFSNQETESAAAVCDGECNTLLCALPTFPNLIGLSIQCIRGKATYHVGEAVRSALSVAAEMQISDIKLRSVKYLHDFSTVPLTPRLCCLTVHNCGIWSLAGLGRYTMLTYLNVSYNSGLGSLGGLAGAPRLMTVVAKSCNLQDVEGLSQCPRLREVYVSYNRNLGSLGGLADAPRLERVEAEGSILQDVEGLSQCPHLREVYVSYNSDLLSLRGLAGAPSLERVVAHQCGLQEVKGLSQCPQLREIYVSENSAPLDLRDLVGASHLELIVAGKCVLLGVEELRSCLPGCKLFL